MKHNSESSRVKKKTRFKYLKINFDELKQKENKIKKVEREK